MKMPPTNWDLFLEDVLGNRAKHYGWLRSLSYLEYIGYRKMIKSLGYEHLNKGAYRHLSDEIQHSFMLRELAQKYFEQDLQALFPLNLIQKISEEYFQQLDCEVSRRVIEMKSGRDVPTATSLPGNFNGVIETNPVGRLSPSPVLCYMLTSYVIEKRAMKVYPSYLSKATEAPVKYTMQKIIRDESEHLTYLEGKMSMVSSMTFQDLHDLIETEENLFQQYLGRMTQELDQIAKKLF
jgi:rubrerythrin